MTTWKKENEILAWHYGYSRGRLKYVEIVSRRLDIITIVDPLSDSDAPILCHLAGSDVHMILLGYLIL
jgi:hypothetical protein